LKLFILQEAYLKGRSKLIVSFGHHIPFSFVVKASFKFRVVMWCFNLNAYFCGLVFLASDMTDYESIDRINDRCFDR
jgi:hypothetical protein